MENISEHVSYAESIHSDTAIEKHIDNTPPDNILAKMKVTALNVFEPIRKRVSELRCGDSPLTIDSFYRSPDLNKEVGGATGSQHMLGEAIDLNVNFPDFSREDLFELIKSEFEFDQLIFEGGTIDNPAWVHVSWSPTHNRKEVLRMVMQDGKPTYAIVQ